MLETDLQALIQRLCVWLEPRFSAFEKHACRLRLRLVEYADEIPTTHRVSDVRTVDLVYLKNLEQWCFIDNGKQTPLTIDITLHDNEDCRAFLSTYPMQAEQKKLSCSPNSVLKALSNVITHRCFTNYTFNLKK